MAAATRGSVTYQEVIDHMSQLGRFGIKLGTERTRAMLDRLGHIDKGMVGALIAGTNGKGSTGAFLSSILRASGSNVGFMPKPHLVSYTERIQLNGEPISESDFVTLFEELRPAFDSVAADIGQATEFEMLTVLAVAYLATRTDYLVCEVGLGGRLDATNALDLGLAVITNVDLDHQKYLGDTIALIANEKAAIIKPGNRVITACEGESLAIVEEHASRAGAELWRVGREVTFTSRDLGWDGHSIDLHGPGFAHRDLHVRLLGEYQPVNAALAVAAAHAMKTTSDDAVRRGVESAVWPGRLQVLAQAPRVIVDGGHNPAALTRAGASLRRLIGDERLIVVFAMLSERNPIDLIAALRTLQPDGVVFTEPASAGGHAIPARELATRFGADAESVVPAGAALERARDRAGRDGNVLVCGSLYLAGEILGGSDSRSES